MAFRLVARQRFRRSLESKRIDELGEESRYAVFTLRRLLVGGCSSRSLCPTAFNQLRTIAFEEFVQHGRHPLTGAGAMPADELQRNQFPASGMCGSAHGSPVNPTMSDKAYTAKALGGGQKPLEKRDEFFPDEWGVDLVERQLRDLGLGSAP